MAIGKTARSRTAYRHESAVSDQNMEREASIQTHLARRDETDKQAIVDAPEPERTGGCQE